MFSTFAAWPSNFDGRLGVQFQRLCYQATTNSLSKDMIFSSFHVSRVLAPQNQRAYFCFVRRLQVKLSCLLHENDSCKLAIHRSVPCRLALFCRRYPLVNLAKHQGKSKVEGMPEPL